MRAATSRFSATTIFTTALPPAVAAAAVASIRHLKSSSAERRGLLRQAARTKERLLAEGLPVMPSESHIVPVLVGNPDLCKRASDRLLERHGIYIQPINFPTVPRGTERLRISPGPPLHSDEMIEELAVALAEVWDTLGMPPASRSASAA